MPALAPQQIALFSSTSAAWSQAGAAHYAAGNSYLDATAAAARAAGLPTTAVNFGPFRCALQHCLCRIIRVHDWHHTNCQ